MFATDNNSSDFLGENTHGRSYYDDDLMMDENAIQLDIDSFDPISGHGRVDGMELDTHTELLSHSHHYHHHGHSPTDPLLHSDSQSSLGDLMQPLSLGAETGPSFFKEEGERVYFSPSSSTHSYSSPQSTYQSHSTPSPSPSLAPSLAPPPTPTPTPAPQPTAPPPALPLNPDVDPVILTVPTTPKPEHPNQSGMAHGIVLTLTHKPRGSAGKYLPVIADEKLRVGTDGKRFRLIVYSPRHLTTSSLLLRVWQYPTRPGSGDPAGFDAGGEGLSVLYSQVAPPTAQFDYGVLYDMRILVRGRVKLVVTDPSTGLSTSTVVFVASNSIKKKKKAAATKSSPAAAAAAAAATTAAPAPAPSTAPSSTSVRTSTPSSFSPASTQVASPSATSPSMTSPISSPCTSVSPRNSISPRNSSTAPASRSHPVRTPASSQGHGNSFPISASAPSTTNAGRFSDGRAPAKRRRTVDEDEDIFSVVSAESGSQITALRSDLDVHGTVRAHGFHQFSDLRLKTDVSSLTEAVSIVRQLQGKRYRWRQGTAMEVETGGKRVIGLIAQEVREVLPEMVREDEDGWLSVSYSQMIPLLVTAFNEHLASEDAFKAEVSDELSEIRASIVMLQSLHSKTDGRHSVAPPPPPPPPPTTHFNFSLFSRVLSPREMLVFGVGLLFAILLIVISTISFLSIKSAGNVDTLLPPVSTVPFSDRDECQMSMSICRRDVDPYMTCVNLYGGFRCECLEGFHDVGGACRRISDRACEYWECQENSSCQNSPTGPLCVCDNGFFTDGLNCTDIGTLNMWDRFTLIETAWEDDVTGTLQRVVRAGNSESHTLVKSIEVDPYELTINMTLVPRVDEDEVFTSLERELYQSFKIDADFVLMKFDHLTYLKRARDSITFTQIFIQVVPAANSCPSSHNNCHPMRPCHLFKLNEMKCGKCNPGWLADGELNCVDLNECTNPTGSVSTTTGSSSVPVCHPARECYNFDGGYSCGECREPYVTVGHRDCALPQSVTTDCEFSWGPWDACSVECSGGIRTRYPIVSIPPSGATAKPCPLPQTSVCNKHDCPTTLGCYLELSPPGLVAHEVEFPRNTNHLCQLYCEDLGMSFAATKMSVCQCSLSIPQISSRISSEKCSSLCPGFSGDGSEVPTDPFLFCGGPRAFQVSMLPLSTPLRLPILSEHTSDTLASGSSIAYGDVDNDGIIDLLVGGEDGLVIHFMGSTSGDSDGIGRARVRETKEVVLDGTQARRFGQSVAVLGDIDGDGLLDIVIGAPDDNTRAPNAGAVYIASLTHAGRITTYNKFLNPVGAGSRWFGSSVATVGDLDGNGVDDIAVGVPGEDDFYYRAGAVWILFLDESRQIVMTRKISATNDHSARLRDLLGPGAYFGHSVSLLGDYDGDGHYDLVVGAPGWEGTGAVFIILLDHNYYVKAEGIYAITNDDFGGSLFNGAFFGGSVSAVHLNRDNIPDLIIGAERDGPFGRIHVLLMKKGGLPYATQRITQPMTLLPGSRFGSALHSVVDFNRDNTPDIAIASRGSLFVALLPDPDDIIVPRENESVDEEDA